MTPGLPAPLEAELTQLRRWKEEATEVILGLQDLGKALGVPLGERITGQTATEKARRLRDRVSELEVALRHIELRADEWVGTKGGDLAASVALAHEPRGMHCKCGTDIGDSIDWHWHIVNRSIDAAGQSLRSLLPPLGEAVESR